MATMINKGSAHRSRRIYISIALILLILYFWTSWRSRSAPTQAADRSDSTGSAANSGSVKVGDGSTGLSKLKFVKSSYDYSQVKHDQQFNFDPLPANFPGAPIPPIQHSFRTRTRVEAEVTESRRQAVKKSFQKSWNSYKKHAWTWDELQPLSGGGKNTFGGLGATLVDSLDTLWIMDLHDEFWEAAGAAVTIDWTNTTDASLSMFETTIRYLGGLISAYELSGEDSILRKAVELGDLLYCAFDTPNRMPAYWVNFEFAKTGSMVPDDHQATASFASLSLEFTKMTQLTGDPKYFDAINQVTKLLAREQYKTAIPGMWPTFANLRDGDFSSDYTFTLGALADSMYEYLPKMYLLLSGRDPVYKKLYRGAAKVVEENLLFRPMVPQNDDILFSGDVTVDSQGHKNLNPESQHLTCFIGGMFGLGGRIFDDKHHVNLGMRLMQGCAYAYNAFPVGIMPEVFSMVTCPTLDECEWDDTKWDANNGLPPGFIGARDTRYILRPEAIESVFILYRITGKPELQEVAWKMFQSIKKATETKLGHAALSDVTVEKEPRQVDSMESFWTAETLKYFYLIFSPPDLISLDEYVFNTEAHPFKRMI